MARARSVRILACALLLAACASSASARPAGTAIDVPAATHPDVCADVVGCAAALFGRHLSTGNFKLKVKVDGAGSALHRRAAASKIVAGSVVGGVALTTLLLAALLLCRRARRTVPAVAIAAGGGRSSDALGAAMDLPKLPPGLTVDTRSPTVHRLTGIAPLQRPASTLRLAGSTSNGSLRSPVDLVARARRCSDWSHLAPSSPASRPGSPSSPRLRTVGSNGSLTFAPSAYQSTINLRPKASTSSLRSPLVTAPAHASLQPLIIPPASPYNPYASASASTSTSTGATSLKRQRSLASMLDIKSGGADSPSADTLLLRVPETPRAVVRYEADALISGCNGARTVRYEVEEDAGTWSEELVRLPPRYSTLRDRPLSTINPASSPTTASVPATMQT